MNKNDRHDEECIVHSQHLIPASGEHLQLVIAAFAQFRSFES